MERLRLVPNSSRQRVVRGAWQAEARKATGKQSAKFVAALKGGVPIVSAEYVLALAGQSMAVDPPAPAPPPPGGKRKACDLHGSGKSATEAIALDDSDSSAAEEEDAESEETLGKLKLAELRERLAARELDTSGRTKAVLIARLLEASPAATPAADLPPAKRAKSGGAAASAAGASPSVAMAAGAAAGRVGAALRQRKHMAAYLLAGGRGGKLPPVSSLLEVVAAAEAKRTPKPRVTLPPIAPKSALVTVDADTGAGPTWHIYVDKYNLAYNTVMNEMDIRSGINRYYKMQLLASKSGKYQVWRAWGRVGGEEAGGSEGRTNSSLINKHESSLANALKVRVRRAGSASACDMCM